MAYGVHVQVSILFEVEDLSQASPATVSRAGMIYLNVEDLGWQPFITSWLAAKKNDVLVTNLTKLIERCGLHHGTSQAACSPSIEPCQMSAFGMGR